MRAIYEVAVTSIEVLVDRLTKDRSNDHSFIQFQAFSTSLCLWFLLENFHMGRLHVFSTKLYWFGINKANFTT